MYVIRSKEVHIYCYHICGLDVSSDMCVFFLQSVKRKLTALVVCEYQGNGFLLVRNKGGDQAVAHQVKHTH